MHTIHIGLQLQCTVQVSVFSNFNIYAKRFFRAMFSANCLISASQSRYLAILTKHDQRSERTDNFR
jgi:hypothetical protein